MDYSVETVNQSTASLMVEFLKKHENYTLFLLGNYENYGSTLTEAPYSGNYKIIRDSEGEVVGVFCLTKKGSLLIESSVREPIFDLVLSSCREENLPLKGVIGRWDLCKPFWAFLKKRQMVSREVFSSKDVLYSLDLSVIQDEPQENIKLLKESDFAAWKPLKIDYLIESGLPNDLSEEQLYQTFLGKVQKKVAWGYFIDEKLVSIADLNAKAFDLGQVGGVYTDPAFRKKGYSKAVLKQLLVDSKKTHSLRKLIIFTGEEIVPAKKLYKNLGASQEGFFALFFGEPKI